MGKDPFDKTDPKLYIIIQKIILDSPENKANLRWNEEEIIFSHVY